MKILLFVCALLFSLSIIGLTLDTSNSYAFDKDHLTLSDSIPAELIRDSILGCGTSALMESLMRNDTVMQRQAAIIEEKIYQATTNPKNPSQIGAKVQYTLPVVVHIVSYNGVGWVSNQQVQQAIVKLNQGFANTGGYNRGAGTDMNIRFMLAIKDPSGQSTTGITRVNSPLTNQTEVGGAQGLALKNLRRWDPDCYINVWVVDYIEGAAGYATYPWWHNRDEDGIVVRASTFSGGTAAASTLIHEFGHYLGLYHTFEGGCYNRDCNRDGDKVCDTPPDKVTIYSSCTQPYNSCSTDTQSGFLSDQYDMISNFMDYTRSSCRHDFTAGQGTRMRSFIRESRSSLLDCGALESPCANPPVVNIDLPSDSILAGVPINITSTNESTIRVNWYIDGESISTDEAFEYTFEEGTYTLLLRGEGSSSFCSIVSDTRILTAYCPTQKLDYSTELVYSDVESPIELKVFPEGIANWEWWLDGEPTGLTDTVERVYLLPGTYTLELKTPDGSEFCGFVPPDPFEIEVPCPGNLADIEADPDQIVLGELAIVDLYSGNLDYIEWFVNGVSVGDPDPLEYTFTEPGTQEVVFFGKNPLEGCADYRDTVYIEVLCPITTVEIQNSIDSIAAGEYLELAASAENTAGFTWTINGITQEEYGPALPVQFDSPGTYEVVLMGNPSFAACQPASDTLNVHSYCAIDSIQLQSMLPYVPIGSEVQFKPTTADQGPYQWYVNGELAGDGPELTYIFESPQQYEITVVGTNSIGSCPNPVGYVSIEAQCPLGGGVTPDRIPYVGEPFRLFLDMFGPLDSVHWYINGIRQPYREVQFEYVAEEAGFYDFAADVFYKGCQIRIKTGTFYTEVKDRCQQEDLVGFHTLSDFGYAGYSSMEAKHGGYYLMSDHGFMKVGQNLEVDWSQVHDFEFVAMAEDPTTGDVLTMAKTYEDVGSVTLIRPLLLKYNQEGSLLWKKEIQSDTLVQTAKDKLVALSDGRYLLSRADDYEYKFSVCSLLDSNGETIWAKHFPGMIIADMDLTEQQTVTVVARTSDSRRIVLIKMNLSGELIWYKSWQANDWPLDTWEHYLPGPLLTPIQNGQLAVSWTQYLSSGFLKTRIARVDKDGNFIETKELNDVRLFGQVPLDLVKTADGGFLLASYALSEEYEDGQMYLTKFNSASKIVWQHKKLLEEGYFPRDLTVLEDGRIVLMGDDDYKSPYLRMLNEFGHPAACPYQVGSSTLLSFDLEELDDEITIVDYPAMELVDHQEELPASPFEGNPKLDELCVSPGTAALDLSLELIEASVCDGRLTVTLNACNIGHLGTQDYFPLTLYAADPTKTTIEPFRLSHILEDMGIPADTCLQVTVSTVNIPEVSTIYAVINDDGTREFPLNLLGVTEEPDFNECSFLNNLDSIQIETVAAQPLGLVEDISICAGEEVVLEADEGFETYEWQSNLELPCTDCRVLTLQPTQDMEIELKASTAAGCTARDSIQIQVLESIRTEQLVEICSGDSAMIFGEWISEAGVYERSFSSSNGCDSTVQIELAMYPAVELQTSQVEMCSGDSVLVFGEWISEAGIYEQSFTSSNGCDSIVQVNLAIHTPIAIQSEISPTCFGQANGEIRLTAEGDMSSYSIQWSTGASGNLLPGLTAGSYSYTLTDSLGCEYQAELEVPTLADIAYDLDWLDPACEGEASGSITLTPISEGLSFSLDGQSFQESGSFQALASGEYSIWIRDLNGCERTTMVQLAEPAPLVLEIPSTLSINQGDTIPIIIGGQTGQISSIQWTPSEGLSCSDCLNPLAYPDADIVYQVNITDDQGCLLSATVSVEVEVVSASSNAASLVGLDPPTAFSPNGDGVNDYFEIRGLERFPRSSLVVVDRSGKVVYQRNDYGNDWDGRGLDGSLLPEGTYYYVLDLKKTNLDLIRGPIALIR